MGQVLRQLAFDGVDSSRLYGTDLEPRFLDAGYDLFKDQYKLKATFVAGDMLSHSGQNGEDDEKLVAAIIGFRCAVSADSPKVTDVLRRQGK